MPKLRTAAKFGIYLSPFIFLLVLFQSSLYSQESRNLLINGGFEDPITNSDWKLRTVNAARETAEKIELDHALAINHGNNARKSYINQRVSADKFSIDGRYVLSANTKIDRDVNGNNELAFIQVRFHGDRTLDERKIFRANGDTSWKKLSLHFTVPPVPPGKTKSLRVFLRASNTIKRTWFDHVQLLEKGSKDGDLLDGDDAIDNGDFQNGLVGWNTSDGSILETDSAQSNSGTNSLKIVGVAGSESAFKYISLSNRGFDPDKPVYTVSANIKTQFFSLGEANSNGVDGLLDIPALLASLISGGLTDPTPAYANTALWDLESTTLPPTLGKGACIQIKCFDGQDLIRKINTPYFRSKSNAYQERKFSFLVPKGTDGLRIVLGVAGDEGTVAHFDDVRLVKNDIVDHSLGPQEELIRDVGHQYNVVEAPEVGTSVNVADYSSIQAAIDEVSDVKHSNFGKIVWVPAGLYEDDYRIFLRSGLHLKMHKDAMFVRTADPGNPKSMWHGAFIRNAVWSDPISDVIVEGGSYFNLNNTGGSPLAITGDRIECRSFNVLSYTTRNTPASALYFLGYDISIHHNSISGAAGWKGIDGIHLWGGGRAHIMSNDVLTGDDGIGLFTGAVKKFPQTGVNLTNYNRSISAVECFNNRLDSQGARAFACGIVSFVASATPIRLTSTIEDVRCRNFVGRCGGGNQMITINCVPAKNELNLPFGMTAVQEPQIRRILIENGNVKGKKYTLTGSTRPPKGISVYTGDVGSVEDVFFRNIKVSNVANHQYQPSVILEVHKSRWDIGTAQQIEEIGHNNRYVRFKDCILDSISLDENDIPDGGEQAKYLFQIDGERWVETYNPAHLGAWFNFLNAFGSPSTNFGLREWRPVRHSVVPGR